MAHTRGRPETPETHPETTETRPETPKTPRTTSSQTSNRPRLSTLRDRRPVPLSTTSFTTPVRLHSFTGDDSVDSMSATTWFEEFCRFADADPTSTAPLSNTAMNLLTSSLDGVALKLYVAIKPSFPQPLKAMLLENFPEITAASAKADFDALCQTDPFAGHLVEFRRRYFVAVARDPDCRLNDSSLAEKLRTSLTPALAEELYKWQLSTFSGMVDKAVHLAPLFPVPSTVTLNVVASALQPLTDEERDRCRREGRCFRCREPGQMSSQCPRSQPGNARG